MERLIEVTSPQISPDATTVVVTAARADLPNDRLLVRLDRFDVRSGAAATIVAERPGLSSLAMAPDGKRVAFLAPDAAGDDQIFIVRTAGGTPRRITEAKTGVEQFAWRPDGAALAYVSVDGPPHRSGAARFRDAFHVGNDSYRATAIPPPAHLYVVSADGTGARRLTEGSLEHPRRRGPDGDLVVARWEGDRVRARARRDPERPRRLDDLDLRRRDRTAAQTDRQRRA